MIKKVCHRLCPEEPWGAVLVQLILLLAVVLYFGAHLVAAIADGRLPLGGTP